MIRLGKASALLGVFAGDYAILMLINGQLTDFDFSAGVSAVALLGAALFEYVFKLSRKTLADERAAVWSVWAWKARKPATTVEQAMAPLKPSVVGYLTVRRAGAAVSASQLAECHARNQRDDPAAAGRSHHHTRWLRGSLWIRAVPFAGDVLIKREFLAGNDSDRVTCRDLADDLDRGRLVPGCMIGQRTDRMIRAADRSMSNSCLK
jgi:hypothetical protein